MAVPENGAAIRWHAMWHQELACGPDGDSGSRVLRVAIQCINRPRGIDVVPTGSVIELVTADQQKRPGSKQPEQFMLVGAGRSGGKPLPKYQ